MRNVNVTELLSGRRDKVRGRDHRQKLDRWNPRSRRSRPGHYVNPVRALKPTWDLTWGYARTTVACYRERMDQTLRYPSCVSGMKGFKRRPKRLAVIKLINPNFIFLAMDVRTDLDINGHITRIVMAQCLHVKTVNFNL